MTDSADLERRYRRLLKCFPARYRRDHEQEVLSVLMASSEDGQRKPRLADSADLLASAGLMWWREATRQPRWRWERRHPRLIISLRVAIGFWLLVLTGILLSQRYWWGAVIVLPAALHFYLAYRLRRSTEAAG